MAVFDQAAGHGCVVCRETFGVLDALSCLQQDVPNTRDPKDMSEDLTACQREYVKYVEDVFVNGHVSGRDEASPKPRQCSQKGNCSNGSTSHQSTHNQGTRHHAGHKSFATTQSPHTLYATTMGFTTGFVRSHINPPPNPIHPLTSHPPSSPA